MSPGYYWSLTLGAVQHGAVAAPSGIFDFGALITPIVRGMDWMLGFNTGPPRWREMKCSTVDCSVLRCYTAGNQPRFGQLQQMYRSTIPGPGDRAFHTQPAIHPNITVVLENLGTNQSTNNTWDESLQSIYPQGLWSRYFKAHWFSAIPFPTWYLEHLFFTSALLLPTSAPLCRRWGAVRSRRSRRQWGISHSPDGGF